MDKFVFILFIKAHSTIFLSISCIAFCNFQARRWKNYFRWMSPSMIFNSFLKFEIFNPGDSHKLHFQIKVCRSWQLSVENVPNDIVLRNLCTLRKKPSVGVLMKRYSEDVQPIYRKTPTPKCDFYKVAL